MRRIWFGGGEHNEQLCRVPKGLFKFGEAVVVLCLSIAGIFKGDRHLKRAIILIVQLLGVDASAISVAADENQIPSRQTLALRRFHLDTAFCIRVRESLQQFLNQAAQGLGEFVAFFLCNSSPRVGWDSLLGELRIAKRLQVKTHWWI